MGITAITIENFKGIREPVRVELKPITLLFGPNSAGKSTIVQALHYASEVFEKQNLNPDRTLTGGDSVDLGGFRNFVHKHDTSRPIRLGFDFRFTSDTAHSFPSIANSLRPESAESEHFLNFYWDLSEDVLEPWLEVTIRWSPFLNRPIICSYKTGFGEKLFAEIIASEDGKRRSLSYLDLKNVLFLRQKMVKVLFTHI